MTENRLGLEAASQKFTYYPGMGDPDEVKFRGMTFKKGHAVKVEDPEAIRKLTNNPSFMAPERREEFLAQRTREMDSAMQERARYDLLRAKQHMQGLADAQGSQISAGDLDGVPIEVPSDQIDRPTTPSPAANVPRNPAIDQRRLVYLYKDRAKGLANSSLSEDTIFLKQFWPKISREQVREIRRKHAPARWQKAGRRS